MKKIITLLWALTLVSGVWAAPFHSAKNDTTNIELGQANPYIWDGGNGVEYEMVDVDNTLSCHLIFDLPGAEDVEANTEYSSADKILLEFSYLSVLRHEYKITEATFLKQLEDETVTITATITDERGNIYNLRYYDEGFHPSGDTVLLTINEPLSVTHWEEYFEWVLYAEDQSTIVSISLEGGAEMDILGDVTEKVSLWNSRIEILTNPFTQNWDYIQLNSAESVVVSGEEGDYAMDAILIAENGITYVVAVNKKQQGVEKPHVFGTRLATKILRDGQLLIRIDDSTYTVTGQKLNYNM